MSYLVHHLLENSAQQYPDKEAVVYFKDCVASPMAIAIITSFGKEL
ncbi:MAG: hypothetical protein WBA39_28840 [Rivularia sp. (in: cyanobacteria)]